jgi:hypothetical protein
VVLVNAGSMGSLTWVRQRKAIARMLFAPPVSTSAGLSKAKSPADLPIELAATFELVINLTTAKASPSIDVNRAWASKHRSAVWLRRNKFSC